MRLSREFFVQHKWIFKYIYVDSELEYPVGYLEIKKDGLFCDFEMTNIDDKFYISGRCSIGYIEIYI